MLFARAVLAHGCGVAGRDVADMAGAGFGDPLEMVDEEKLRRLRRAGEAWLARNPDCVALDCRFEVVAVRPGQLERVTV